MVVLRFEYYPVVVYLLIILHKLRVLFLLLYQRESMVLQDQSSTLMYAPSSGGISTVPSITTSTVMSLKYQKRFERLTHLHPPEFIGALGKDAYKLSIDFY